MKRWLILLCVLGSFSFAEMITLKDGTVLHGVISQYTEESFVLKTFDNREFTVYWSFLHQINRDELQQKLGLATKTPQVELVKGVVMYLRNGATLRGRVVSKGDLVVVKTKNGNISVPRNNIVKVEKAKVPITDVYSVSEIYKKVEGRYDFDNADEQWKLANYLVAIGAVEQAKKHFDRAQELSPEYAEKSQALAGEFDKFSEQQEEQKIYRKYQLYLRAGRYKDAKEVLKELGTYKTEEEIAEYIKKIDEKEATYYTKNVASLFFSKISSQITSLSLDRKITIDEAKEKLLGDVYDQALKDVATKYSLSEAQVTSYIEKREKRNLSNHNFGRGTFVVGLGRDTSKVENFAKVKALAQSQGRRVVSQKISAEDWWKKESSSQKREWLHGFFWLNKLQIQKEQWKICPQCRAQGFVKSGRRNVSCPRCQGVKFERVVFVH
ncbi:hypothetical protein [Candidatus Uabimicrobium amorphum]|uniref:Tetratricopeptide repeat protein n=1 Tax=Uabimicrobium amorphum TaxID=2596890 RepID=A0A5S9IPM0_UABAM|nr:hypothetical protein [Candidatus Uabimicrobium amorphum]BBM85286.1 hypothetical protein UABAM_03650 [Candidatus Uabimicrobium amorphum]